MDKEMQSLEIPREDFNENQWNAINLCINDDSSVLCTGQGGTGKSKLIGSLVSYYRRRPICSGRHVAVTASTGIAAFMIRGITLHRFAGVGIEEADIDTMIEKASSGASKAYWEETSVLIIDEISMISASFFQNLSLMGRHFKDPTKPFGGIKLLMFGDFLQLPPISKTDNNQMRAFHTDAWNELNPTIVYLTQTMRQKDKDFQFVLSEIRQGICSEFSENYIIQMSRVVQYEDNIEPVRLFARRSTTDEYNQQRLQTIHSTPKTFRSTDSGDLRLLNQCPASASISLKQGSQVMLIRNMNHEAVNGSIGTILGFEYMKEARTFQPRVKFTRPDGESFELLLGNTSWEMVSPSGKILAKRTQVPLILAWAMTIHKSQGQTIPRLIVDMAGIFENGQAYVALSRCSNPSNLQVVNFRKHLITAAPSCVSFYNQLLQNTENAISSYSSPFENTKTDATRVAEDTSQQWDNNRVSTSLIEAPTLDTQIMLGQLSLQETSVSSHSDSEN